MVAFALPSQPAQAQERVDLPSGRLSLVETDLSLQAGPVVLEIARRLQSPPGQADAFGRHWRGSWETSLARLDKLALLADHQGSQAFSQSEDKTRYRGASGATLVFEDDGAATLTRPDGTRESFDAAGRLVARVHPNGAEIALTYREDGSLARMEGAFGAALDVSYDAEGRLSAITASNGTTLRYAYESGALVSASAENGPATDYGYDEAGRLVSIAFPGQPEIRFDYDDLDRVVAERLGGVLVAGYSYDDAAREVRIVDALGHERRVRWSENGRRQEVTDALGHTAVIETAGDGRSQRVTGPSGSSSEVAYDALGRVVRAVDPSGRTFAYEYLEETSYPSRVTRPDGLIEAFHYDANRNLVKKTVGDSVEFEASYTAEGLLARLAGATAPEESYRYDAAGRLVAMTDGLGNTTSFDYDARGNLVRETDPEGAVIAYAYDEQDRLVSETDPLGATTRFEYDHHGNLTAVVHPDGRRSRYQYDARGRLTRESDRAGRSTRYDYDDLDRLVAIRHGDGRSEAYRYDAAGNLVGVTDLWGRDFAYRYDALGRLIEESLDGTTQRSHSYDAAGNLIETRQAGGSRQSFAHDALGRVTAAADGEGAPLRGDYDALGRVTGVVDPLGNATRLSYAADGGVDAVTAANGDELHLEADAAGRVTRIHRPGGGTDQRSYDKAGRLLGETDPLGQATTYGYDSAGRQVSVTDPDGGVTQLIYDNLGQVVERRLPDGTRVTYRYDAAGRRILADDGSFPIRWGYDSDGRLRRIDTPALGKSLSYDHTPEGLRSRLRLPDGTAIAYRYDALARLIAIVLPDGREIGFRYGEDGRRAAIAYPNGVTGSWHYDDLGRVDRIRYEHAEQGLLGEERYAYDAAGRVVEAESGAGVTRYRYDPAGQLLEETGPDRSAIYSYGPGGNRTSATIDGTTTAYAYDQADRLVTAGEAALGYDARGNLIERGGAEARRYRYDPQNRLVAVEGAAGGTVTYGYDPTGDRAWREDSEGRTYFLHDGLDLVQTLDADGATQATFVFAPGIDRPLALLRGEETFFYHADRLGSVRWLSDGEGRVAASYAYDAFGSLLRQSGEIDNPFTFTAREYDAAADLYFFRARYYSAELGRFLSVDPVAAAPEEILRHNPYLYAANDPVNARDALGLEPSYFFEGYMPEDLDRMTPGQLRRALDDVLSRLPGAESYHERYNDRFTRHHLDTIIRARDAIQQRLLSGRAPAGGGGSGTLAGAAGPSPAGQGSGTLAGQRPAGAGGGGSGTLVGQRPAGVGARGSNTLVSPRPGDVDTRVLPGGRPGGAPGDTRVTNTRGGGSSRVAGIGRSVRLGLGAAIAVTNIRACIAEGKDPASCIAKEGGKAVVIAGVGLAVGAVVGTASTPVIVVAAGTGVVLTGLGAKGARNRLIDAQVVNEINDKLFPAQLAKLQAGLKALEGLANDARRKIDAANSSAGELSSIRADILNGLRQRQGLLDPRQVGSFCGRVMPKALEVLYGAENVLDTAREAESKFAQAIRTMNACIADPASAQEAVLQDANASIGDAKSLAREAAEDYTTLLTEAEQIEALFDDLEADVVQKIESADRALDTNREALQTLLEGVQGEAEAADQAFHSFADARDRLLADVDHSYAVLKDFLKDGSLRQLGSLQQSIAAYRDTGLKRSRNYVNDMALARDVLRQTADSAESDLASFQSEVEECRRTTAPMGVVLDVTDSVSALSERIDEADKARDDCIAAVEALGGEAYAQAEGALKRAEAAAAAAAKLAGAASAALQVASSADQSVQALTGETGRIQKKIGAFQQACSQAKQAAGQIDSLGKSNEDQAQTMQGTCLRNARSSAKDACLVPLQVKPDMKAAEVQALAAKAQASASESDGAAGQCKALHTAIGAQLGAAIRANDSLTELQGKLAESPGDEAAAFQSRVDGMEGTVGEALAQAQGAESSAGAAGGHATDAATAAAEVAQLLAPLQGASEAQSLIQKANAASGEAKGAAAAAVRDSSSAVATATKASAALAGLKAAAAQLTGGDLTCSLPAASLATSQQAASIAKGFLNGAESAAQIAADCAAQLADQAAKRKDKEEAEEEEEEKKKDDDEEKTEGKQVAEGDGKKGDDEPKGENCDPTDPMQDCFDPLAGSGGSGSSGGGQGKDGDTAGALAAATAFQESGGGDGGGSGNGGSGGGGLGTAVAIPSGETDPQSGGSGGGTSSGGTGSSGSGTTAPSKPPDDDDLDCMMDPDCFLGGGTKAVKTTGTSTTEQACKALGAGCYLEQGTGVCRCPSSGTSSGGGTSTGGGTAGGTTAGGTSSGGGTGSGGSQPGTQTAAGYNIDVGPLWGGADPCGLCKEAQYDNCMSLPSGNAPFCRQASNRCRPCPAGADLSIQAVKTACFKSILRAKAKATPERPLALLEEKSERTCSCVRGSKCEGWQEGDRFR